MVPSEGKRYDPAKRCIYCPATVYSEKRERFGDEHIIPLGLDGTMILPQAACLMCEQAINRYEQPLQRSTLAPLRNLMGLKTRNPAERPEAVEMNATLTDGSKVSVSVPAWFAPSMLVMPIFHYPGIMEDKAPEECRDELPALMHQSIGLPDMMEIWGFGRNVESVQANPITFTGVMFARLMAKIGFCYAVAEQPHRRDEFAHLAKYVLGKENETDIPRSYYVGSEPGRGPQSTYLHEIRMGRRKTPTQEVTVVQIRLFAHLMSPTYYVVVSPRL